MASAFIKVKEFFGFIEENEQIQSAEKKSESDKPLIMRSFRGALLNNTPIRQVPLSEIKIEEPRIYEDSLHIATHLRDNIPVIINLKYLDASSGKRLVDFICGTAYAINGHMMKIGDNIFLFTPENILIAESGDKSQLDNLDLEDKNSFFKKAVA